MNNNTSAITIKNFGKIDDLYYRGGQPSMQEIRLLAKLEVKAVINLRKPFEFNKKGLMDQQALANGLGMNYINIPMFQPIPPTNVQINLFYNVLNNPNNLPVFVHCDHGKDRTGIMTALYRVIFYKWDFDQAYSEMKKYGYHSVLFPEQKYFLSDFTERFIIK